MNTVTTHANKRNLWHSGLEHASKGVITKHIPLVDGSNTMNYNELRPFEPRLKGNRLDIRETKSIQKTERPIDLVHFDKAVPL